MLTKGALIFRLLPAYFAMVSHNSFVLDEDGVPHIMQLCLE